MRGLHHAADCPIDVASFHFLDRKCDNGIARAQRRKRLQRSLDAGDEILVADGAVTAYADQQHAFGAGAGHRAQQQRGARFSADVAGLQGGRHFTGAVEIDRLWRKCFVVEYGNGDTAGFRRREGVLGIDRFYAKVHLLLHWLFHSVDMLLFYLTDSLEL
jgi:hypothetical protein